MQVISVLKTNLRINYIFMAEKRGQSSEKSSWELPFSITLLINGSKIQVVFLVMLVTILPFLMGFLEQFNEIVKYRKEGNLEYPWPEYSDLWLAVKSLCFLLVLQFGLKKALLPFTEKTISAKYTGQERQDRAVRQVNSIFGCVYFTFAFVWGYYVSKDSYFLPPSLGGDGSAGLMFKDFPYQGREQFPQIREYIMVQLGYHMHSFIVHVFSKPRNDFVEMLLHHSVTVFLIILAYFMNYVTISHLVLFVHDLSDIFICCTKALVDTDSTFFTMSCYGLVMVTWSYMRLFIFPTEIIYWGFYNNPLPEQEVHGKWLLGTMLHFLLVLHLYWYYLLIKMGLRFALKGKKEDIQQDLSNSKQ